MAARVDAADDFDQLGRGDVEQRVWKAAQQSAAGVLLDFLIGVGIPLDRSQASLYRPEELGSQPGTLVLVPAISRLNIVLRLRAKDQRPAHRVPNSRAFTSDHGFPTPGFAA